MFRFFGTGVVWDKSKNRSLCRFDQVTGTYETNDKREIEALKGIGFNFQEFDPEDVPSDESEPMVDLEKMTKAELVHFAEQNKIELYEKATKAQMIVAINVAMGGENERNDTGNK